MEKSSSQFFLTNTHQFYYLVYCIACICIIVLFVFSPSLTERSPSPVQGVHIFNVKRENSTVCTGDVTYVPPQADGPHQLCLQVSLPG
jgi:hypothetical protein